jgi:hypothetical protein
VWNKLFRMELIRRHQVLAPDLRKAQDRFFCLAYLAHCDSFYYLTEPLVFYRVHPASVTQTSKSLDLCWHIQALDSAAFAPFGVPAEEAQAIAYHRWVCGYGNHMMLALLEPEAMRFGPATRCLRKLLREHSFPRYLADPDNLFYGMLHHRRLRPVGLALRGCLRLRWAGGFLALARPVWRWLKARPA